MIISYITTIREKKQIETCKFFEKAKKRGSFKKLPRLFTKLYGICARSFGKNVSFTRAKPFSFG